MPKKFFKKYSPDPKRIKETPGLSFLGDKLHQPNLWHFNRHSVTKAFAIGLFCCWIPFPFQSPIAAAAAIYFRANLALSVALVFVTNPITIPPMFYFAYQLGNLILGGQEVAFKFELSWALLSSLGNIWQPLVLGCFLMGLFSSMLGFLVVQFLWRHNIREQRRNRSKRSVNKKETSSETPPD